MITGFLGRPPQKRLGRNHHQERGQRHLTGEDELEHGQGRDRQNRQRQHPTFMMKPAVVGADEGQGAPLRFGLERRHVAEGEDAREHHTRSPKAVANRPKSAIDSVLGQHDEIHEREDEPAAPTR